MDIATSVSIAIQILSAFLSYNDNAVPEPIRIAGKTMGTTYHITYFDEKDRQLKNEIDSLLLVINSSINTYDAHSEVSQFNTNPDGVKFNLPYLREPVEKAKEVFYASSGAFDITVMPLVNAWGFGPGKEMTPTRQQIDSIKAFVGFEKVNIQADRLTKSDPRTQLDFGGIGQGYGADVVSRFLRAKGIDNFLVELGGEGVASGHNLKSMRRWQIGILDPNSTIENQFFKAYVSLSDKAFTTAGNYFKFREVNGKKYSHTIDPVTGYPADRNILSASVFSADCTTADAWDTAFMVMGHEKAIETLKLHPELEALLLYSGENGKVLSYATPGIASFITLEH